MATRKFLCAVLAALMAFSAVACRNNSGSESFVSEHQESSPTSAKSDITLLYCYSDTFDPYTASSDINRQLCRLIYDPLVKLDNSFKPVYQLASSAEQNSDDKKRWTVKLRPSKFSDGSSVTAEDVVYSYTLAKKSSTMYASKLYNVRSASAADASTIIFELSVNDPLFINLIDFPILKSGSEKITDSDGVYLPPIGSGRYMVGGGGQSLIQNEFYYGTKGAIKTINLIDAPDAASVSHYVEVGATDVYYTDLSDATIVRMSGKKAEVNLNNLVYIGINSSYGNLADKEMRYAISSAINRTAICRDAYYNNAVAAKGFITPLFEDISAVQTINEKNDIEITIENLGKIGYNILDESGYRINSNGKRPIYTLLVNEENQSRVKAAELIAGQLKAAGIEIKILKRPFAQYKEALESGNFQLYLGEIKILDNMDLSPLVLPGGAAAYGVSLKNKTDIVDDTQQIISDQPLGYAKMIEQYYADGSVTLNDVASSLLSEMPQIPICYRKGLLFYSSDIEGGVDTSQSDIYFSIEEYILKNNSGG